MFPIKAVDNLFFTRREISTTRRVRPHPAVLCNVCADVSVRVNESPGARIGVDPHHARGLRGVLAARPALLGREGLDRHVAPGGKGLLAGKAAVPGDAY